MIQVQIEVDNGASRLRVSARASSVGRALKLVGRSHPGVKVRVAPPDEPAQPPADATVNGIASNPSA